MPLSDLDRQLLLIQDVGDVDPVTGDPVLPTAQGSTGIVMQNIGRLWLKYADKAVISPTYRDLYVQLEAYDLTIGILERLVDFSTANGQISVKLSQRVDARKKQRDAISAAIIRFELLLSRSNAPMVGLIAATAPIDPPLPGYTGQKSLTGPDANNPRYSGSPYIRSLRNRP